MKKNTPFTNLFRISVFTIGILLGVLLAGGLIWSDVEAVFYGLTRLTNESFGGLACPPLMTRSETANLLVTVRNETDLPITPLVRIEISTSGVAFGDRVQVPLEPGQSATLEWPVSADNIDLTRFIFAKAYRYPDYQTPLAEATCGILVLDVPGLNGKSLLAVWLGASLLCVLAGLWSLENAGQLKNTILIALRLMTVVTLLAILFGLLGIWPPGMLMLVIVVLLTTVLLFLAVSH